MTEESKVVRGCWISHPTLGEAVVTAVCDDWLWTRTETVSESTGDKVWPASAVLASEATFMRDPDDASRVILAKRGAYGTDLVDPREAEIEALRDQLDDARTRQRSAEAQAEHHKAEAVFQERRAKRAEERAARLEDQITGPIPSIFDGWSRERIDAYRQAIGASPSEDTETGTLPKPDGVGP
jgi:hypothetical protein